MALKDIQLAAMTQNASSHTIKAASDTPPHTPGSPSWKDIVLAPMDGVTDLPMRLWLGLTSAPVAAITPFLRVTADFPVHRIPSNFCPAGEDSLGMSVRPQLMGSCPITLARFVNHLLKTHGIVDINMGCPAPKVVGNMGGSGLIQCQKSLKVFLERLFQEVPPGRVSIKTRLGFNDPCEAQDLLGLLGSFPLAEITLHGRTRAQKYRGRADWSHIGQMAQTQPVPLSGSGDIVSASSLKAAAACAPTIQRFVVGRGLLRNPWLRHEIHSGRPALLEPAALVASLQAFVSINNSVLAAYHESKDPRQGLATVFEKLAGMQTLGSQSSLKASFWQDAHALLQSGQPWQPSRQPHVFGTLGRLKMLWNYLNTSLPPRFACPSILRVRTCEDFFEALNRTIADDRAYHADNPMPVAIQASPAWDWKFSGEARTNKSEPIDGASL